RDGRVHGPGAANIPAMSVAGAAPLVSVSQAGRGRRGGFCDYGADRSALSGAALLWLAPDGGMAGDPRPSRQPQAGAAPDAAVGTGGDLPAPEDEQAGSSAQDLSVPAARARDRAGQSSVVLRRYLHPDGQGFLYLVVIMDWVSRAVLAWRVSNTLGADFCVEALEEALLGYRTPRQIYQEGLWICGRSAVPTGCASPASSESGEMLAFAHIPTGTTVNKTIDVDDSKSRGVAPATAPTLIGADIETGRATP